MRQRLDPLVERGALSGEQADLVAAELADADRGRWRSPEGVSGLVEAAGYLGAALVAAAVVRIGDAVWRELDVWAQASVLLLLGAALWAGGRWVRPSQAVTGAADRLAGVLWLLAVAAWTGMAAVLVEAFAVPSDWRPLLVGLAGTAVAVPLWLTRRATLQLAAVFAAAMATLGGAVLVADPDAVWSWSLLVTAAGIAWTVLVWGRVLAPARIGYALGAATAAVGPQIAVGDAPLFSSIAGLIVAVGLLAASVTTRRASLAAVGTIAATGYVLQLGERLLPGELGWTIGLLAGGSALIAGSLATLRTAARGHAGPDATDE